VLPPRFGVTLFYGTCPAKRLNLVCIEFRYLADILIYASGTANPRTLPAAWKPRKGCQLSFWIVACCKENPVFCRKESLTGSDLTGCRVNRDPYLYLGVIFYVTDVSLLEDEVKLLYLPLPPFFLFSGALFR
jgi:hypothetical protein